MYLSLGSNQGDSPAILDSAVSELGKVLSELRRSRLYRTRPRYVEDQPDFYNLAVGGLCDLEPLELLLATQAIEAAHGRDRSRERVKGPRSLDIDIILYGDRILELPGLTVPHPGLNERAFVLVPLLDLNPSLIHPISRLPLFRLLAELPEQGIYPIEGPGL